MLERLEVRPGKRTRLGRPAPAPAHVRLWLEFLEARNMPGSSGLFGNLWQIPGVDLQPLVAAGDGPGSGPGLGSQTSPQVRSGQSDDRLDLLDQTRGDHEGSPLGRIGRDPRGDRLAGAVSESATLGMGVPIRSPDEAGAGQSLQTIGVFDGMPPADPSGNAGSLVSGSFSLSPPCQDENCEAQASGGQIPEFSLVQGHVADPISVSNDHVGLLTIDVSNFARDPNHVVSVTQTRFVLKSNGTEEYGYNIDLATLVVDSDRHGTLSMHLSDGPVGISDLPHDGSLEIAFSSTVHFTAHGTAAGTVDFDGPGVTGGGSGGRFGIEAGVSLGIVWSGAHVISPPSERQ